MPGSAVKATNMDGEPLGKPIGAARLKLALKAVDREQLEELRTKQNKSQLAEHFDVEVHDIEGVEAYYKLPPIKLAQLRSLPKSVDVDALAERIWCSIELKVVQMQESKAEELAKTIMIFNDIDNQANRLWVKLRPLVQQEIKDVMKESLGG